MFQEKNVSTDVAWKMIVSRDKQEPTQGYLNLALLAKCPGEIDRIPLNQIKQAFNDRRWEKNELEFKKQNSKLIGLLQLPIVPQV